MKDQMRKATRAKAIEATDLEILGDLEYLRQQNDADIAVPLDKLYGFAVRQCERLKFLLDLREVAAEDYDYAIGQCHQIGELLRKEGRKILW